jgi:chemotaxis protein MotB
MKQLLLLLFVIGAFAAQAQSKANTAFMSKRYKACLAERDGLCSDNRELRNEIKNLKQDTATLHSKIKQQDSLYNALNGKYNQLASTSDSKLADLSAKLDTKSRELNAKELNLQQKDKRLKELESLLAKQDSILNQLNNTIKNALLGFKSDEFSTEMKNGKVYVRLSDKLLFKSGAVNIEDKGKEAIKKLAEVLNKNADIDIAVEGHTDSIPIKTAQYKDNWDLSVARATNIVRSLNEEHRVDAKRLTSSGKGEFVPVASNSTPEGRAKNRRTEIVLSPKLEELFKMLDSRKK